MTITPANSSPRCLITSVSNKFFPSLLNLLGSIENNYPNHPHIYVYDLGLSMCFKKELQKIEGVTVLQMSHFVSFWRSCYTWKTYIFANPLAKLNLYIDAGSQVLRSLDPMFEIIERDDYITVEQKISLDLMTPSDYKPQFDFDQKYYNQNAVTAGIFGFKMDSSVSTALVELFDKAKEGFCLGFSPTEQWKNKGKNKNPFIRDCRMFRHDTTMLNLVLRKHLGDFAVQNADKYGGDSSPQSHPEQFIWNFRMNYRNLDFISARNLHKNPPIIAYINRTIIRAFMFARSIRLTLKGK